MGTVTTGIFAGMDTDVLQAALSKAQLAYIALASGSQGESFSYAMGDGGQKSVTYTRASIANLVQLISQMKAALGLECRPRRPIRPVTR